MGPARPRSARTHNVKGSCSGPYSGEPPGRGGQLVECLAGDVGECLLVSGIDPATVGAA
jgi:hypothetical protein